MKQVFDHIAYRLLARLPAYTPVMYYRLQQEAIAGGYCYSGLRGPYWWALLRSRFADLYWALRP